jgi:hypothetical protein
MEISSSTLRVVIPPYAESGFDGSPTASRAVAIAEGSAPKPKTRCLYNGCKTKLGLTAITCNCGIKFCGSHRAAEAHECTFDYRTDALKQLSSIHVKVVGQKIDYI